MKGVLGAVILAPAVVLLGACGGSDRAALETLEDSASYAIGMNWGQQLRQVRDDINLDALFAGVADVAEGRDTAGGLQLTPAEFQSVMQRFVARLQGSDTEATAGNRERGDAYRAENGAREGVTTTESGLQYEVLVAGSGRKPSATDRVRVHYRGTLVDGSEFESSYGGEPVDFPLGQVIAGWTEGLQLMGVGAKYRFVIPPELAYGDQRGPGGAGSTLVFEVELLEIL